MCADRGIDTAPNNAAKGLFNAVCMFSLTSDVGHIEKKKKQKELVREKIKKTLLGIEKLGGLFRITDVLGDGNCLYNALVKSPDIRFSCPLKFREHLFEAIEERGDLAEHLHYKVAKETDDFEAWIEKMRKPGTWGGTTVALFVCWIFNVNICIVTNSARGFITNDLGKVN